MASFNKVILIGNLTKDPELRYTQSQVPFTTLRLAVNDSYKTRDGEKRERTLFIDVDVWRAQAETACKYLSKGSGCLVEGRLELDRWDDRETGKPRSKIKVVSNNVVFMPRGGGDGGGGGGGYSNRGDSGRGDSDRGDSDRSGSDRGESNADRGQAFEGPDAAPELRDFGLDDDVPF